MKRINITCPACGSRAYLRPASVVYGDKAPDPDAKYYVCGRYPACDCYVAAHRKTMLPMGTLADKALRKKRHDAHVALDSLWKNGIMSRKEAYRLLQLSMGLPAEDAHIAKFSAARCDEVIALSRRFRATAARAAYADMLSAGESTTLPRAVQSAIDARLKLFEDRIASLLYKQAVEMDMAMSILLQSLNVSEEVLRQERAKSIAAVKRTNGQLRLEQKLRELESEAWQD